MKKFVIPIWKKAPFIRLLLPFVFGTIIQHYYSFSTFSLAIACLVLLLAIVVRSSTKISFRYKSILITGFLINSAILLMGALAYNCNDVRMKKNWYGHHYNSSDIVIASIQEEPIEKANSFKAEVELSTLLNGKNTNDVNGRVIIYFQKDSLKKARYGDQVIFKRKLQQIRNSGNPGAYDYQTYCAFKGLYHQVYLKNNEWERLDGKVVNVVDDFLIRSRKLILSILRQNIKGREEAGIAEALLIGYKQDLDKDLVQAYSNTGVVHIIAISGLHLGLIYVMLLWIANRIPVVKSSRISKLILILSALWIFSLLTGASASVLRSAVMFTCILAGDTLQRKASIYNSLAASAFILLSYDPYMLWDVGFQLSYLAVAGIVVIQKPVYDLIYTSNKWLDKVWKLVAVSLAAQVFTTPICIYYFHQFPNYFLLTNIVAVPLSSFVLFLEIFLIIISPVPVFPVYVGKLIGWQIWLMNEFVLFVQTLPFALTKNIHQGLFQTLLIYTLVISLCVWWLQKLKQALLAGLALILLLVCTGIYQQTMPPEKLVIYNVPKHSAIDIIHNNTHYFLGDPELSYGTQLANFHLQPTRIFYNATQLVENCPGFQQNGFHFIQGKKILVIDKDLEILNSGKKLDLDAVVLTKNCRIDIESLLKVFNSRSWIIDASNSLWKIDEWKKQCELLHLRCFIVPERGAYVIDL